MHERIEAMAAPIALLAVGPDFPEGQPARRGGPLAAGASALLRKPDPSSWP